MFKFYLKFAFLNTGPQVSLQTVIDVTPNNMPQAGSNIIDPTTPPVHYHWDQQNENADHPGKEKCLSQACRH